MEPLYRRLERLETREIKLSLEAILPIGQINPLEYLGGERYYQKKREELSYLVSSYLASKGTKVGTGFANELYHAFTPKRGHSQKGSTKPFLTILYGRVLADKLPNEIFREFYDIEGVYFLAGLWSGNSSRFVGDRFTKINVPGRNVKKTIAWTIEKGIKKLKKYEKTTGKELPENDEILKACKEASELQIGLF